MKPVRAMAQSQHLSVENVDKELIKKLKVYAITEDLMLGEALNHILQAFFDSPTLKATNPSKK